MNYFVVLVHYNLYYVLSFIIFIINKNIIEEIMNYDLEPYWIWLWFVPFDLGSSLVSKILVVVVQWWSCFKLDGRHGLNDIIEGVVIIF